MANYLPNEVVDVLLTFGECNTNYRHASCHVELYPNCRHPNVWQVIKKSKNTLHQRQIN